MEPPTQSEDVERAAGLTGGARSRGRRLLKMGIRVGVGAAVLVYLLSQDNLDRIIDRVSEARPGWLAVAFACIVVGLLVSAMRWRVYLNALGLDLPLGPLFRLYFVGTFFNAFLPTGIGGDAYKAVRIGRPRGTYSGAFASVFLDRFAGVAALAVLGFIATASLIATGEGNAVVLLGLALSGAIVAGAAFVLLGGERLARRFLRDHGTSARILKGLTAIAAAGRARHTMGPGLAYGLLFQLLVLAYHLCIARALDIPAGVAAMSAIVVIASLATMIPLTVNGLGFREAAYRWGLTTFGYADAPHALAFAILVLGVLLASSAVGGVVYLVAGGEIPGASGGALVGSVPAEGER